MKYHKHLIVLCVLLSMRNVHAIKFEASDILNPFQVLITSLLLPGIAALNAAQEPDFSEIDTYATDDIKAMCHGWRNGKKPYTVKTQCEMLAEELFIIYDDGTIPSRSYTDPIIKKISKAFGKNRPQSTDQIIHTFNEKMHAIQATLKTYNEQKA